MFAKSSKIRSHARIRFGRVPEANLRKHLNNSYVTGGLCVTEDGVLGATHKGLSVFRAVKVARFPDDIFYPVIRPMRVLHHPVMATSERAEIMPLARHS